MNPASQRVEVYLLDKTRRVFGTGRSPLRPGGEECVHRMRVASRRLRVGLRFFGALFPAGELREIRRQLQRVTQALGAIRTLDVNSELILRAKRTGISSLIHLLAAERAARAAEAENLLEVLRAERFPERIRALIRKQRLPLSDAQLQAAAADRLGDLCDAVRRQFNRYCADGGPQTFHRLRIAVKKYRYALEASQVVFSESGAEPIATAERMQDLMGRCHDLQVVLDWLAGVSGNKPAQQAVPLLEVFTGKHTRRLAKADKFLHTHCDQLSKGAERSKSGR